MRYVGQFSYRAALSHFDMEDTTEKKIPIPTVRPIISAGAWHIHPVADPSKNTQDRIPVTKEGRPNSIAQIKRKIANRRSI